MMLTLRVTWQFQNLRQEFCVFSTKQTAVFHSSTEAEVISLEGGLRLDGIPASGLWDIVMDVLEPHAPGNLMRHPEKKPQTSKSNTVISDPHVVPPNAHTSSQRVSLFIFEDNDAVIKMTVKGRSLVDLDWLFDRFNFDPRILFKYVNTTKQIVDTLTKNSVSRERWSQLTQQFNFFMTPHVRINCTYTHSHVHFPAFQLSDTHTHLTCCAHLGSD